MPDLARSERSEGTELVRRMARRDRAALQRFYDRYAPLAYGLALKIVRERTDAAAVLEQVFWECWREAASFDRERGTPEAWVLLKARARAIARIRATRRRGAPIEAPGADALVLGEGVELVDPFADRGVLTRALDKLPPTQREVVELAFYGGLPQTEIAAHLKQPVGSVKTRLRLGLERLRDTARLVR